jgi:glycosyltransferase involved in cell wall biosynthesis
MGTHEDLDRLGMRRDRIVSLQTTSERGGAEYANVDLLVALAARGHKVVLLTNIPEIAAGTQLAVREIDLGSKLSSRNVGQVALRAPLILARIARALYAERPVGTLLLHFKKEQLLCSLLPPWLTGTIVWAEWGPLPLQMRKGPARWAYALAAQRVRRVMAISPSTLRTVVEAGVPVSRVEIVPAFMDVEEVRFDAVSRVRLRKEWGVQDRTLVIGCISRFHHRKRNDVVIDAVAHMEDDVLLVLAGEGEQEEALRERATPYGDRVLFVPDVRGHQGEFLSACDLFVFAPSPTEGEPRVIVMAQLVGIPVIATDAEGTEGLIGEGGGTIVSPSHDPSALAAVIGVYSADPERRRREGEATREKILESHDPERTLRMIEGVLRVSREGQRPYSGDHALKPGADDKRREVNAPTRGAPRVWRSPSRRSRRSTSTTKKPG